MNKIVLLAGTLMLAASCGNAQQKNTTAKKPATSPDAAAMPAPYATKSARKFADVKGWEAGKQPTAPPGFAVTRYADGLRSCRWIYQGPNGDVFVSEANTEGKTLLKAAVAIAGKSNSIRLRGSPDVVLLFRDTNGDGTPDVKDTLLRGLSQPFGMLVLNGYFYVANTDAVWRYAYKPGQTRITTVGEKILDMPKGGYNNHWTRNLIANADGSKIYVSVGSGSNVAEHGMEHEVRRANILEMNPDGTGLRVYASGLRNPVGMDWAPGTNTLWTAVNERDGLGDDLVPDYITGVKDGGFYGWPYSYFGANEDPRMKDNQRPDLVKQALVPDVALGSHTASLGLAFYNKAAFPHRYRGGAFIGQHGSWNRSEFVGYRVAFVPFANGKPSGPPEDFLTGFIADADKGDVYGRPVGVTVLNDGSMLVADDAADIIWRVAAKR